MPKLKHALAAVISISSVIASAQEALPNYKYSLLKDTRSSATLPVYTNEEKKIILDQSYMVMNELFVHRDLKFRNFGTGIDPLPLIKNLEARAEMASDQDFHEELSQIFLKQNDLHTTYSNPKPLSCYRSMLPFSFKQVKDLNGTKVIAVSSRTSIKDVIDLIPEIDVRIGYTLVSIDGVPANEAAERWRLKSGGANPDAVTRRTISLLSFVSQKYNSFPAKDTAEVTLKSRQGLLYTVNAPWVTRVDPECIKPEKKDEEEESANADMAADDYQNDFNRTYRPSKMKTQKGMLASGLKDTAEPILKYKIVSNEYGDFAYLSLESFVPEKLTTDEVVKEVKKLLQNELSKTDGLIFDLRSNGGGYIYLAEALVQLFTPNNPVPLNFVFKNTPATRHFVFETFSQSHTNYLALKEAEASGAEYTAPTPLFNPALISTVGQFYFKPVALLTNASCYSSCDMFSAQMQDQAGAVIFGEERTTGAGGANNWTLNDMIKSLTTAEADLAPFKKLPGRQDLGFSFRQSIRVGKNAGEYIEDRGILSDIIAEATLSDLYTNSGDQFKLIGKVLNERADNFRSWVKSPDTTQDVLAGAEVEVFLKWNETDKIEIYSGSVLVDTLTVEETNLAGRSLKLPKVPDNGYASKEIDYQLKGFFKGKKVWRKMFISRTIPLPTPIDGDFVIDLTSGTSMEFFHLLNHSDNGWQITENTLKVGKEDEYANSVKSHASLFAKLTDAKEFNLTFDAEVKTEKDFDYFRVKLFVEGKEINLIQGLSGEVPLKDYSFDLSAYKGKSVEIRFVFESDGGLTDVGPVVKNIKIISK